MSSKISNKSLAGWQAAIDHSEGELKQVEQRAEQLRMAISTFKANLKRGVPWPGQKTTLQVTATQN